MLILVLGFMFFFFSFCYVLRRYIKVKKYVKNFKTVMGICTNDYRTVGLFEGRNGARSHPCIVYTVNSRQYEILSKVTYEGVVAFMITGKKFKVLYNPDDPKDAILANELTSCILFCFICIIFISVLFCLSYYDFL